MHQIAVVDQQDSQAAACGVLDDAQQLAPLKRQRQRATKPGFACLFTGLEIQAEVDQLLLRQANTARLLERVARVAG